MARDAKRQQSTLESAVLAAIRAAMKKQMTQKALAEKVGLSAGQLSDIFNGHKPATFTEMSDLARAVGLDFGKLVSQEEGDRPAPRRRGVKAKAPVKRRRPTPTGEAVNPEGHNSVSSPTACQ